MSDPKPRFTGIFIPVEILEIEDLTLLDQILLSWVDALYDKDHGGCFAKNEYLAKRLKVKENTIAKSLTKLRHIGLIEDISFDGRNRVIKACIGKHQEKAQSNAALDLNPTQTLTKIQPWIGQKSNPIYKDESKEEKETSNTSKEETGNLAKDSLKIPEYIKPLKIPLEDKLRLSLVNESCYRQALEQGKLRHKKGKVKDINSYVVGTALKIAEKLGHKLDWPSFYETLNFYKENDES